MDIALERRRLDLYEQTQGWIAQNPDVYDRFVELALSKVSRREPFSMSTLVEVVKWDAKTRFSRNVAIPSEYKRYIGLRLAEDYPEVEHYCTTKREPTTFAQRALKPTTQVFEDPGVADILEEMNTPVTFVTDAVDFEDLFK